MPFYFHDVPIKNRDVPWQVVQITGGNRTLLM